MIRSTRFGLGLFGLGIANLFAFFVHTLVVHGDARRGKIEDGRYFLGNRGGSFVEVDRSTFDRNYLHATTLFVTHPAAFAGVLLVILGRRREAARS